MIIYQYLRQLIVGNVCKLCAMELRNYQLVNGVRFQ
jgi:hypothetical protein